MTIKLVKSINNGFNITVDTSIVNKKCSDRYGLTEINEKRPDKQIIQCFKYCYLFISRNEWHKYLPLQIQNGITFSYESEKDDIIENLPIIPVPGRSSNYDIPEGNFEQKIECHIFVTINSEILPVFLSFGDYNKLI